MSDRIEKLIDLAIEEDIGTGDITTDTIVGRDGPGRNAEIQVCEDCVVAGLEIARRVFLKIDGRIRFGSLAQDGAFVKKGTVIAKITGPWDGLLKAERVALNFLQHLSGVATLTRKFVEEVKGTKAEITDTRKTTPGLRALEKHAVHLGGGVNHRLGLYDRFLIKNNHLEGISITAAVQDAKKNNDNHVPVEVEVKNLDEVREALSAGADIIMLDNMSCREMKNAVRLMAGRARLEASGSVTLKNVRKVAKTGVDMISVGALTHSAPAIDIHMIVT